MDSEGGAIVRKQKNADGGQPSAVERGASLNGSTPHFITNGHRDQSPDYASLAAKLAADGLRTRDELEAEQALLTQGLHDEGNAQCLNLRYAGQFAQNDAFGWMTYTGTHWTRQGAEAALDRAIVETLSARIQAALDSGQADKHGPLIKFAVPSNARVQGAKALYSSLVYTPESTFDNNPDLLNCSNGVVNLRTGELTPHAPGQRFMHCVDIPYKPKANAARWVDWLTSAVKDPKIVEWLQLAVGYSLTGHTREEVLFYLYGPPRSGKGTFTEALLTLLGSPLAEVVTFSTLTSTTEADTQNFNLAPLHSSRLVVASESNQYERFNEAKVKQLTGGDKIQCAFKHKTAFSYRPKYKLWLASNQPVNADPDDDAVWGRVRVVHFPESHLGKEDKLLKDTMRTPAILEGILAWAVQGAINWYQLGGAGLPELESSAKIKSSQRAELDQVQAWIDECCKPGEFTGTSALYSSYQNWCKDNGVTAKRQKGLTSSLQRKGYGYMHKWLNGKTVRVVTGVELI